MLELDPQRRITVAAAKEPSGLRGAGGVYRRLFTPPGREQEHPWMRGLSEASDAAPQPFRPASPLEDISEYSDEGEDGAHTRERRGAAAVHRRGALAIGGRDQLQDDRLHSRKMEVELEELIALRVRQLEQHGAIAHPLSLVRVDLVLRRDRHDHVQVWMDLMMVD